MNWLCSRHQIFHLSCKDCIDGVSIGSFVWDNTRSSQFMMFCPFCSNIDGFPHSSFEPVLRSSLDVSTLPVHYTVIVGDVVLYGWFVICGLWWRIVFELFGFPPHVHFYFLYNLPVSHMMLEPLVCVLNSPLLVVNTGSV